MNTACAVLRFCPNLPEEFFRVRQFLCVFLPVRSSRSPLRMLRRFPQPTRSYIGLHACCKPMFLSVRTAAALCAFIRPRER